MWCCRVLPFGDLVTFSVCGFQIGKLTQIHKLSNGSRFFIGATAFGLLLTNSCSSLLYSYTIVSNTLGGSPSTLPLGCQALLIISITLWIRPPWLPASSVGHPEDCDCWLHTGVECCHLVCTTSDAHHMSIAVRQASSVVKLLPSVLACGGKLRLSFSGMSELL